MKNKIIKFYLSKFFLGVVLAAAVCLVCVTVADAQIGAGNGNTITGHIFGYERQPLEDIYVELLNEYSQSIQQTRTNSSGRYHFAGLPPGRFQVRVLPYGTDYQEQVADDIEIVNFVRESMNGARRLSGFSNEQRDFYLKLRNNSLGGTTGAVFVQEIPAEAKELYEQGVKNLRKEKEKEGLENLKSALELFPKYYAALEKLGLEYVRLKHFEAAAILFSIAVDVNPRGYWSWYGLGYSLNALNKYDEALDAVQKANEIYSDSTTALLLEGFLLRKKGKFQEAEKVLIKAKESTKKPLAEIHWELASLYAFNLKRYRDAAKELTLYLKAAPKLDKEKTEKIKKLIAEYETKPEEK